MIRVADKKYCACARRKTLYICQRCCIRFAIHATKCFLTCFGRVKSAFAEAGERGFYFPGAAA